MRARWRGLEAAAARLQNKRESRNLFLPTPTSTFLPLLYARKFRRRPRCRLVSRWCRVIDASPRNKYIRKQSAGDGDRNCVWRFLGLQKDAARSSLCGDARRESEMDALLSTARKKWAAARTWTWKSGALCSLAEKLRIVTHAKCSTLKGRENLIQRGHFSLSHECGHGSQKYRQKVVCVVWNQQLYGVS